MFRTRLVRLLIAVAIFGTMVLASNLASATSIVYDNTTTDTDFYYPDGQNEFGDEITLAGTERLVTAFTFSYLGDFTGENDETARIRFYVNDGTGGAPDTLLYDSGAFSIFSGINVHTLSGLSVVVPDTYTWVVQWGGTTQTVDDNAGLLIYDPPTVGASGDYFWMKDDTGWSMYTFAGVVANFYAQVEAIPEPGTLLLLGGGLAGLAFYRRKKIKKV